MTRDAAPFARALAISCAAAALLLSAAGGPPTRDRPPPAHTGGFGEPTCQTCHFQAQVNAGPGSVLLQGLPERFRPDSTYTLVVLVTQPGLAAGGFQLAIRDAETGAQSGTLRVLPAEDARAAISTQARVQYAHHTADGLLPDRTDSIRWTVQWTAPAEPRTAVVHAVGNAADDDFSPLGDHIYAWSRPIPAGSPASR